MTWRLRSLHRPRTNDRESVVSVAESPRVEETVGVAVELVGRPVSVHFDTPSIRNSTFEILSTFRRGGPEDAALELLPDWRIPRPPMREQTATSPAHFAEVVPEQERRRALSPAAPPTKYVSSQHLLQLDCVPSAVIGRRSLPRRDSSLDRGTDSLARGTGFELPTVFSGAAGGVPPGKESTLAPRLGTDASDPVREIVSVPAGDAAGAGVHPGTNSAGVEDNPELVAPHSADYPEVPRVLRPWESRRRSCRRS